MTSINDNKAMTKNKFSQEYDANAGRTYNQFTRNTYDVCEYENELRIGSKPMKYYVNQLNTPIVTPFNDFTAVGNKRVYNVENEYQRALPTRLNGISQTYVLPYSTTPNLGQAAPSMLYSDTQSNLRFGSNLRQKKSSVILSEIDYNQWSPGVSAETVQNAGANYNSGRGIDSEGYYDYKASNNVLFANGAFPIGGISSRNELHNFQEVNKC